MGEDILLSANSQPNYNRILQPRALYFLADARCTFTPAYTIKHARQSILTPVAVHAIGPQD